MVDAKTRWLFVETNLLNVRLVFLSTAFFHLVVTAAVTLSIDTALDENPRVRSYIYVRWMLLTCWFNLLTLVYLPVRIYADWKTKRGEGNRSDVKSLNHATDVLMTGLLMPITVFADAIFWSLYITDPGLLAPVLVFKYLPYWSQHSLHSVSLAFVLVDLLLTPRRRPSSMKTRLTLLSCFLTVYTTVVYYSLWRSVIVYAFFEHLSVFQPRILYTIWITHED